MFNCFSFFLLMVAAIGIYAIVLNVQQLVFISHIVSNSYENLSGLAFDCAVRPLVSQFAICLFTFLTMILALTFLLSASFCPCIYGSCVDAFFFVGLYTLYGPILLMTCMYFLINIKDYSYTCTPPDYQKKYSYKTHVIAAILAFVAVLVTFSLCAKKLIKHLSRTLRNDQSCFTKLVNAFVCKADNPQPDEEEVEGLNLEEREVVRNQL